MGESKMTKVLYTGSFDPITKGHMNIIEQVSALFDEVIVAVLQNSAKQNSFFTIEENLESALEYFKKKNTKDVTAVFPKIFECPICSKRLKASKSGRFRCSECKTILAIDNNGQVFLG